MEYISQYIIYNVLPEAIHNPDTGCITKPVIAFANIRKVCNSSKFSLINKEDDPAPKLFGFPISTSADLCAAQTLINPRL